MFKSALFKDFLKEIWTTKSRFLSIMLIVALGTGFFAGIKGTGKDMQNTSDIYFEETNFFDAQVVSTLGLSNNDITQLKAQPNVQAVEGAFQLDFIATAEEFSGVVRVHSYETGENAMNRFVLISGRLPETPGEILVEDLREEPTSGLGTHFDIGEKITLDTGTKNDIKDYLKNKEYTIVGTVASPMYISIGRGNTNIGSGSVSYFAYLPSGEFALEAFTSAYIKLADTAGLETYSDEYLQSTKNISASLEILEATRSTERLAEIKAEPTQELKEAEEELSEEKAKAEKELAEAWQKLADSRQLLLDGEEAIKQGWVDYNNQMAQGEAELASAKAKLDEGERLYAAGMQQYLAGKAEFDANYANATQQIAQLEQLIAGAQAGLALEGSALEQAKTAYQQGYAEWEIMHTAAQASGDPAKIEEACLKKEQLDIELIALTQQEAAYAQSAGTVQAMNAQLASAKQLLAESEQKLAAAKAQLDASRVQLDTGIAQLASGRQQLESGRTEGAHILAEKQEEIKDGWAKLNDGYEEYYEGKAEFEKEITDAQEKIDDAWQELDELKPAEWFITVRDKVADISEYKDNAGRIDKISTVFPVFFLIIAALVCLTTMTRMVDDQRVQIGTLKAMGYSRIAVAMKFLMYAFLASLLGSVIGTGIGFFVFPNIIFSAYNVMLYRLPPIQLLFQWEIAIPTIIVSVVSMVAVTFFTCFKSLKSEPAPLLRPAAPKSGKRILLEHVGFIWRKLSFSWKVTLRNLFRYKKRMLMTIIGISGCTALMMAGFVLKDAISGISDIQFGEIFKYDMVAVLESDTKDTAPIEEYLADSNAVEGSMLMSNITAEGYANGSKSHELIIIPVEDKQEFETFIDLHERTSNNAIEIEEGGVVVSEKLTQLLDLSVGDYITLEVDGVAKEVKITAIAENYTFNYVYITNNLYKQEFGITPIPNRIAINLKADYEAETVIKEDIAAEMIEFDDVITVSIVKDMISFMDDQMKALDTVVLVLVGCASLLAFIVMYNLTNINIMERTREIATIKVLGFYENETAGYVYRENIILSVIGALVGLVLGIALGRMVTVTASLDSIMFSTQITPFSFIISFALTMMFTIIVGFAVKSRLKKIDMIEALKSVD